MPEVNSRGSRAHQQGWPTFVSVVIGGTGEGVLGGYIGEGVAASNLAGRTMGELVAERDTERTSLPWVGVSSRRWAPEPLRFESLPER